MGPLLIQLIAHFKRQAYTLTPDILLRRGWYLIVWMAWTINKIEMQRSAHFRLHLSELALNKSWNLKMTSGWLESIRRREGVGAVKKREWAMRELGRNHDWIVFEGGKGWHWKIDCSQRSEWQTENFGVYLTDSMWCINGKGWGWTKEGWYESCDLGRNEENRWTEERLRQLRQLQ